MGIFSRTRDIFAANMAELLDRADDPAKMVRVMISEMEDTLVEVRSAAARTIADQKEMRRHIQRFQELETSWTEKAELALSKDREDLAKAALAERRKATEMAQQLTSEITQLDDALRSAEDDIAKLQTKLREARTRQNAIATRFESANTKAKLREMWNGPRTHEAFSRFETLERRADEAEGRAEAMGLSPRTLDDEFNDLRSSERIDADLAAMKARLNRNANGGE
jgi:phage shock protein A